MKLRQGRPVLADGEPTESAPVKSPPSTNTSVLSTSGVESNKKKGSARGPYANYDNGIMKQMMDAGVKLLLFQGGGGELKAYADMAMVSATIQIPRTTLLRHYNKAE